MNRTFIAGAASLVFTVIGAGQSIVQPPPGCETQLQQLKAAGRTNQAAVAGCPAPIVGLGTPGVIPVFASPNALGDSVMVQSATGAIGIGGPAKGSAKLGVAGSIDSTGTIHATGDITSNGAIGAQGVTLQSGNVTAGGAVTAGGIVTSGSQFNIGSNRVLAVGGTGNTFAGIGAGLNSSGASNTVVGTNAAPFNSGSNNSMFGASAGESNSGGSDNTFVGSRSAQFNSTGSGNAFVGTETGQFNNGSENTFIGHSAGKTFSGGNNNTLVGAGTVASNGVQNATAIGNHSVALQSDTLILGGVNGINGGKSVNVGIGTAQPATRLEVGGGDIYLSSAGTGIILKTVQGFNCVRLSVSSSFQLSVQSVNCPGNSGF